VFEDMNTFLNKVGFCESTLTQFSQTFDDRVGQFASKEKAISFINSGHLQFFEVSFELEAGISKCCSHIYAVLICLSSMLCQTTIQFLNKTKLVQTSYANGSFHQKVTSLLKREEKRLIDSLQIHKMGLQSMSRRSSDVEYEIQFPVDKIGVRQLRKTCTLLVSTRNHACKGKLCRVSPLTPGN